MPIIRACSPGVAQPLALKAAVILQQAEAGNLIKMYLTNGWTLLSSRLHFTFRMIHCREQPVVSI